MEETPAFKTSSATADDAVGPLAPLFDVACTVDFILGTGMLKVRHCVGLTERSVIRLDQAAGSDLELRVHGQSVAHGEVVIVDDNTALRINRVVSLAGGHDR